MTNIKAFEAQLRAKSKELKHAEVQRDQIVIERAAETLDQIQLTTEREIALSSLSRNWQTAADVNDALARVANGSYGICLECEEPLTERRLNAIPWARLCIRCQENVDRAKTHADHVQFADAA